MLGWLQRRRASREIPEPDWRRVLAGHPFLASRSHGELARLRELAGCFLAAKEFHGAQGFVITDTVALTIALQAVLPLLHLAPAHKPRTALRWYDDFVGIVVHPDEVVARRSLADETGVVHDYAEVLAGEAMDGGPVMLNWKDVSTAGETAERGYNLVIHEFIHKIDLRDGEADGCPPLPSRAARRQWRATIDAEFERFREQVVMAERFGGEAPWLDAYGAESIGEFFAVAGEAYFVNRRRFEAAFPALLTLFDGFFDPGRPANPGEQ
jgi:Mlc titration factor MtfA (ptsG expression regulator)